MTPAKWEMQPRERKRAKERKMTDGAARFQTQVEKCREEDEEDDDDSSREEAHDNPVTGQQKSANMTEMEMRRKKRNLRERQKRANATKAELEMRLEKRRIRERKRRANVTLEEMDIRLGKRRTRERQRRAKERMDFSTSTNDATATREKEKVTRTRPELGVPIEIRAKANAQRSVVKRIDNALWAISEVKKMKMDLTNWRSNKRKDNSLQEDPELEDDCTWKELLLWEIKLEFQNQSNRLAEEALEIELGPNVPNPESPLSDPNWRGEKYSTPMLRNYKIDLALASGQESVSTSDPVDDVDDYDDDENTSSLNDVEIKIEQDEMRIWNELCEENDAEERNDVANWIADVVAGHCAGTEEGGGTEGSKISSNQQENLRKPKTPSEFTSTSAGTVDSQTSGNGSNIIVPKSQSRRSRNKIILEKFHKTFLTARKTWIDSRPEDTEKRAKVDQERIVIKGCISNEKRAMVDKVVKELIHKRDVFSQETQTQREARISKCHDAIAENLVKTTERVAKLRTMTKTERKEKKQQRLIMTANLTKEEIKRKQADIARTRIRMEKLEYNMHLTILLATGCPPPTRKSSMQPTTTITGNGPSTDSIGTGEISVQDFESAFKIDLNIQAIEYWNNFATNVFRCTTRPEVTSYRKMLFELLTTRRNSSANINSISSTTFEAEAHATSQSEWVSLPEHQSLQDIRRFKDFIAKYGEHVGEHLTYKRFYVHELQKFGPRRLLPEQKDRHRIKGNEKARRYYIKRKYGIILGEGEYFDRRTMSAVKKPPKVYMAWERRREENPTIGIENRTRPKNFGTRQYNPRGPRMGNKSSASTIANASESAIDSTVTQAAISTFTKSTSSIEGDNSNSSDRFAGSGPPTVVEDNSSDGWVPIGSSENESLSTGGGQQQNFNFPQPQNLQFHQMGLRSNVYPHSYHHNQNPHVAQLGLIDQFTNQMDSNYNAQVQWNPNQFSPKASQNAYGTMPYFQSQLSSFQQQLPTPTSSLAQDKLSITNDVEPPSHHKRKSRGRPSRVASNANTSQQSASEPKRDIWNNRKRRKFYPNCETVKRSPLVVETQSPFERTPQQIRDAALNENIAHLLPKCPHCDKVVNDDATLKAHIAKRHPNPKDKLSFKKQKRNSDGPGGKVSCPLCLTDFQDRFYVIRHMFMVHFEGKLYNCPFADLGSKPCTCVGHKYTRSRLNDHITRQHPKETKADWVLGIHLGKVMLGKEKFWCLQCEKHFSSYSDLKEHVAGSHGRYCCVICGIYLRMDDHWIDHVKLFHGDKQYLSVPLPVQVDEKDLFRCMECDSEFSAQTFLDEHKAGGHSFLVDDTDAKHTLSEAESKTMLRSHVEDYPAEPSVSEARSDTYWDKPYKCEICTRSYMELNALRLHSTESHELYRYLQSIKRKNLSNPTQTLEDNTTDAGGLTRGNPEIVRYSGHETSCPVCNTTDHNLHWTHTSFDKLIKRYCSQCDRLFSRNVVLRQHREASHGILPEDQEYPPPLGRIDSLSEDPNCITCSSRHCGRSFTSQEFHSLHLFLEKHPIVEERQRLSNQRELLQEDYDKLTSTTTLTTSSGEISIFSCRVCLKNFKTLEFLRAHIAHTHKEDAFSRVLCEKCNYTFISKESLRKHNSAQHNNDKRNQFLCPVCDQPISRVNHVKRHMKKMHPNESYQVDKVKVVPFTEATQNTFMCKICTSYFKTEIGLKSHMTNKHFPTHWSTFCEFCGLQRNPKKMKDHVDMEHPQMKEDLLSIKRKPRLSLPELVEMIHALDKDSKQQAKKRIIKSMRPVSKCSKSSMKKKQRKNDSSSEDESSFDEADSEILESDAEFGDETEVSEDDVADTPVEMCSPVKSNSKCNRKRIRTKRLRLDVDSETDSEHSKSRKSSGRISQRARRNDLTIKSANSKISKMGKMLNVVDSENEPNDEDDNRSDIDSEPCDIMSRRSSAASMKKRRLSKNSNSILSTPTTVQPVASLNISRKLLIRLERCDQDVMKIPNSHGTCPFPSSSVKNISQTQGVSPQPGQTPNQSEKRSKVNDIFINNNPVLVKDEVIDEDDAQDNWDNIDSTSQWQYFQLEREEDDEDYVKHDQLHGIQPGFI